MKYFWYLCLLIIFVVVVCFCLLNQQKLELNYFVGIKEIPVYLIVIISFVIGGILGMIIPKILKINRKKG